MKSNRRAHAKKKSSESSISSNNISIENATNLEVNNSVEILPPSSPPNLKLHQCRFCHKTFGSARRLTVHITRQHGSKNPFSCRQCSEAFSSPSELKRHESMAHADERKTLAAFVCEECGKIFRERKRYTYHRKTRHSVDFVTSLPKRKTSAVADKTLLQCHECGRCFSTSAVLRRHVLGHSGLKPFACSSCPKSFVRSWNLGQHLKSHHTDNCGNASGGGDTSSIHMHMCELCGKRFGSTGNLTIHKRSHTGEKPFGCPQCERRFMHSSDVRRHQRLHTGERPFVCEDCGATFNQNVVLQKHARIHHGVAKEKYSRKKTSDIWYNQYNRPPYSVIVGKKNNTRRKGDSSSSITSTRTIPESSFSVATSLDSFVTTTTNTSDESTTTYAVACDASSSGLDADDESDGDLLNRKIDRLSRLLATNVTGSDCRIAATPRESTTEIDVDLVCDSIDQLDFGVDKDDDRWSNKVDKEDDVDDKRSTVGFVKESRGDGKLQEGSSREVSTECVESCRNDVDVAIDNVIGDGIKFLEMHLSVSPMKKSEACLGNFGKNLDSELRVSEQSLERSSELRAVDIESIGAKSEEPVDVVINKEERSKRGKKGGKCATGGIKLNAKRPNSHSSGIREGRIFRKRKKILSEHACLQCGKKFKSNAFLSRHSLRHGISGAEKALFVCEICRKSFARHYSLTTHMKTHYKVNERRHACADCGMAFATSTQLRKHSRLHTGEKPYACHFCQRRFRHSSDVNRHARTHTGEKPHQCHQCGDRFVQAAALTRHSVVHEHRFEFACGVCPRRFCRKYDLTTHARVHSGENLCYCEKCGRSFARGSILKWHQIKVHKTEAGSV